MDLFILKTDVEKFTSTNKKTLHLIFNRMGAWSNGRVLDLYHPGRGLDTYPGPIASILEQVDNLLYAQANCLLLLELQEILEISWNFVVAPGKIYS